MFRTIGPGRLSLEALCMSSQVPEARMIRHVKDVSGTLGTIIVSEIDGYFDVSNRAHVKAANDIEIRLADQDLLPLYVEL
jgi:hypothetical protein